MKEHDKNKSKVNCHSLTLNKNRTSLSLDTVGLIDDVVLSQRTTVEGCYCTFVRFAFPVSPLTFLQRAHQSGKRFDFCLCLYHTCILYWACRRTNAVIPYFNMSIESDTTGYDRIHFLLTADRTPAFSSGSVLSSGY
eukprot:scaffold15966_cov52-Attheya_sp.AAC.5